MSVTYRNIMQLKSAWENFVAFHVVYTSVCVLAGGVCGGNQG